MPMVPESYRILFTAYMISVGYRAVRGTVGFCLYNDVTGASIIVSWADEHTHNSIGLQKYNLQRVKYEKAIYVTASLL